MKLCYPEGIAVKTRPTEAARLVLLAGLAHPRHVLGRLNSAVHPTYLGSLPSDPEFLCARASNGWSLKTKVHMHQTYACNAGGLIQPLHESLC